MRSPLTTLLVFLLFSAVAQQNTTVQRKAMKVVADLTAPEMHGRGYVNEGDRLAAAYIAEQMKAHGLRCFKQGMEQGFSFPVNTFPGKMSVVVNGVALDPGEDFIVHPASGGVTGSFGIVRFAMDDLLGMSSGVDLTKLSGNALLIDIPETKDRDSLMLFLGVMEMLMDFGPVITLKEKLTWSVAQRSFSFPLIEVKKDAWNKRASQVDIDIENELIENHYASNVIGYVKGRKKKKEHIVITAHYDHLGRMGSDTYFPGANDNASGVAMLLSLAEYFSRNRPERTVVFMAFAGEEAGLIGSHHYIENPYFDLEDIRFLINLDILGTGDDGIMLVNATKETEEYEQMVRINERTDRLAAVKKRGPACNSDHCAFVEKGVPAFFIYTLGGVAFYHDVYDRGETLPLTKFSELHEQLIDFISELE